MEFTKYFFSFFIIAQIDKFAEDKFTGNFYPQMCQYKLMYTKLSETLPTFAIFSSFDPLIIQTIMWRSCFQRCSVKKGVYKNFAKFTGKHLYQSLFLNKVSALRLLVLIKKRPWHRCFPVNFAKLLTMSFLQKTTEWLFLTAACNGFS